MKKINEILELSFHDYQMMLFGSYSRWCESNAKTYSNVGGVETEIIDVKDWQLLLANSQLNNWFNIEYAKWEQEFIKLIKRYEGSETVTVKDIRRCYSDCTIQIFSIYPKAIVEAILKKKKPTVLKIDGIKIQTLTFNQN